MAHNWDDYAKDWEANPATETFAQSVFEQLVQLVDFKGKHVLDFGCGTGLLSQKLSPFVKDIVALDGSEAMIEELDQKQLANVEPVVDVLSRGLVAQHPAFRGQFDLIVASSVCGFIDDLGTALTISHSLLEQDGWFIHWDWLAQNEQEGMTLESAERALVEAGFKDVQVKPTFSIEVDGKSMPVLVGIGRRR